MSNPPQKGTKPAPAATAKPSAGPPGTRMADAAIANLKLEPCKFCKRTFVIDRLATHESVCTQNKSKNKDTKQKPYDAAKHRISGTPADNTGKKKQKSDVNQAKPTPNNWKEQHEALIQNVRNAKLVQAHLDSGGKASDLPPPPPSDYSDYVECPYCGRRFNEAAAERHIPACKDMIHNKGQTSSVPVPGPSGNTLKSGK